MAPHPASRLTKEDNSSLTKAGIRPEIHHYRAVRGAIATIISARIAISRLIRISMSAANGMVLWLIVLFDVIIKMREISNSIGDGTPIPKRFSDAAVPAASPRQEAAVMEIIDDDVTMTVEIAMVIEGIKEVVGVVVVVGMSSGTKTKVRPVSPVSSLT